MPASSSSPSTATPNANKINGDWSSAHNAAESPLPPPVERARSKLPPSLVNAFEKLRQGSDPVRTIDQTINELWMPSFDTPLASAQEPAIAQGDILPLELMESETGNVPLFEQIREGKVAMADSEEERQALIGMFSMYAALMNHEGVKGTALPDVLMSRQESLPPTKGDALVYQIAAETLLGTTSGGTLDNLQIEKWKRMANAKNPVYRLIALQSFRKVSSDRSTHSEFYRSYLDETDPAMIMVLVDELVKGGTSDNLGVLNELADVQQKGGRTDLVEYAESKKALLQSRLAESDAP